MLSSETEIQPEFVTFLAKCLKSSTVLIGLLGAASDLR